VKCIKRYIKQYAVYNQYAGKDSVWRSVDTDIAPFNGNIRVFNSFDNDNHLARESFVKDAGRNSSGTRELQRSASLFMSDNDEGFTPGLALNMPFTNSTFKVTSKTPINVNVSLNKENLWGISEDDSLGSNDSIEHLFDDIDSAGVPMFIKKLRSRVAATTALALDVEDDTVTELAQPNKDKNIDVGYDAIQFDEKNAVTTDQMDSVYHCSMVNVNHVATRLLISPPLDLHMDGNTAPAIPISNQFRSQIVQNGTINRNRKSMSSNPDGRMNRRAIKHTQDTERIYKKKILNSIDGSRKSPLDQNKSKGAYTHHSLYFPTS